MPNGEITESKLVNSHEIAEKKARRERIATALLAGVYANPNLSGMRAEHAIENVIECADALIAALDEAKK